MAGKSTTPQNRIKNKIEKDRKKIFLLTCLYSMKAFAASKKLTLWITLALPILAILCVFTKLFASSATEPVDITLARLFFSQTGDHWPHKTDFIWHFFYFAAPWLTGLLALGALFALLRSLKQANTELRRKSVFVLLVIALGPGLIVNTILKPYWGRPRPRQIQELGGQESFKWIHQPNWGAPGKSLPCGHCSVGHSYASLAYLSPSPVLFWSIQVGSFLLGSLMGLGRMADGAHFASDVLISYLSVQIVIWFLFYYVFGGTWTKIHDSAHSPWRKWTQKHPRLLYTLVGLGSFLLVGVLSIASPFYQEIQFEKEKILDLDLSQSHWPKSWKLVETTEGPALRITGEVRGFGIPKSHVEIPIESSLDHYKIQLKKTGFFSDLESELLIQVNRQKIQNIYTDQ